LLQKMVVLIGMPGSGKSTIGRILAQEMKVPFIDTDHLIRDREKKTLEEIQGEGGMQHFLQIEENTLLSLDDTPKIVATGGSAVLCEHAMMYLSSVAVVVFLDVDLHMLTRRIGDPKKRGVVLGKTQTIASLFFERRPLYLRNADIRIHLRHTRPHVVAEQVMKKLAERGIWERSNSDG